MRDLTSQIMRRISDEIRLIDSSLTTGKGVTNMEQYKKLLGEREGLQRSLNVIDEVLTEENQAE